MERLTYRVGAFYPHAFRFTHSIIVHHGSDLDLILNDAIFWSLPISFIADSL